MSRLDRGIASSTVDVMDDGPLQLGGDDIKVDVIRLGNEPVAVVADGYARVIANRDCPAFCV